MGKLDFICRMTALFGSESGTCACKNPSDCPFKGDKQKSLGELQTILDDGKKELEKLFGKDD